MRVVKVLAGEQVLAPHTAASAVLVPTGPGLVVFPTGGYPAVPHHAWLPMGVTGVVRGAERNAWVSGRPRRGGDRHSRGRVPLRMVPAVRGERLAGGRGTMGSMSVPDQLLTIERVALLGHLDFFTGAPGHVLAAVARGLSR